MKRLNNGERPYSPREEMALIHGYMNKLAPRVIAKRLGRSCKSITAKAHQLRMRGRLHGGVDRSQRSDRPMQPLTDFMDAR